LVKAVIPAAGFGTRFLPVTKTIPKEMLPIVNKPTIQFVVEEAVHSGITEILIVTGRGKRAIEDYFDNNPELETFLRERGNSEALQRVMEVNKMASIHFIRQNEPKGLGEAILHAESFVGNDDFAVLLGDDLICSDEPALKQLLNHYHKDKGSYVLLQEIHDSSIKDYGVASGIEEGNDFFRLSKIVEKPKEPETKLAVVGRYILQPDIFNQLREEKPSGELQLTGALARMKPLYGVRLKGTRYDIGSKKGYLQANIAFGKIQGLV
jgi:UTP--glucose-1-phosphate uridylyltransferase